MERVVNMTKKDLMAAVTGSQSLKEAALANETINVTGIAINKESDRPVVYLVTSDGRVFGTNAGSMMDGAELIADCLEDSGEVIMQLSLKKGTGSNQFLDIKVL